MAAEQNRTYDYLLPRSTRSYEYLPYRIISYDEQ